jgi:hypothetical protein
VNELFEMMVWIVALVAGLTGPVLVIYSFRGRQRLRELAIRERIALIEKGLVPSPEIDPARFETLVGLQRPAGSVGARYRSAGVLIMGLGAALLVLLTFAAGVPEVALGVGGGLAVLGVAAFVNGSLVSEPRRTADRDLMPKPPLT